MIIAVLLFFILAFTGFSQPGPPNPGGQPSGPPLQHHNAVPVGGGHGVLILLSLFYAAGQVCLVSRKRKIQG